MCKYCKSENFCVSFISCDPTYSTDKCEFTSRIHIQCFVMSKFPKPKYQNIFSEFLVWLKT